MDPQSCSSYLFLCKEPRVHGEPRVRFGEECLLPERVDADVAGEIVSSAASSLRARTTDWGWIWEPGDSSETRDGSDVW